MTVFTRPFANATLPLVKSIVTDILEEGRALRRYISAHGESSDSHEEYRMRNRILQRYIEELEDLGCIYADYSFSVGTVHFPALFHDCEVFMSWHLGEDEILYYHEVREQESHRRAIPGEYLQPEGGMEGGARVEYETSLA